MAAFSVKLIVAQETILNKSHCLMGDKTPRICEHLTEIKTMAAKWVDWRSMILFGGIADKLDTVYFFQEDSAYVKDIKLSLMSGLSICQVT